jgi:hypothetical protein
MLKAYKTECKYDQSESSSQKKASWYLSVTILTRSTFLNFS